MSTPSIRFWNGVAFGVALGIPAGMLLLAIVFGVGRPATGKYQALHGDRLLDSASGVDNTGSRYWWAPCVLK